MISVHTSLQHPFEAGDIVRSSALLGAHTLSGWQEMYFRHLYATLAQPTLDQRRKSWENYVRLFNIILNTQVNMQVREQRGVSPALAAQCSLWQSAMVACQQLGSACFQPAC